MSDVDRESPRAAIRKWIQNTENKSKLETSDPRPEQQKGEGRIRHRSESRSGRRYRSVGHESGSKKQAHDELGGRHKPPKIRELQSKLIVEEPQRVNPRQKLQFRKDPKPRPGEPGFAEHLELHAPFRNFKVQGDDPGIDVKTTSLRRKRRHTTSSTSSYLEPAICNDISEDHETERVITQNSGMLLPSQTASPSPKKPTKTYERRSRHKTREDRYELKDSYNKEKRKKAAKKAGREKEPKDKKRRDKLGAALMHEFKAQNVSHDRLTLKPAKALGLFGKGRASSPVRRQGLPDLAFSEMTFLNHRREKPGDSARHADSRPSDSRKRRKAIKEADAEAVISRYFTAAKAPNGDAMNPRVRQEHDEEVRMSRGHDSPPPFVELPDRPFLGFGSCGANSSISPVKPLEVFEPRDIGRRQIRSPTRSTSYPTWSQSGAPLQSSLPLVRQEPLPLESSKLSNSEGVSPKPYTTGNSMPSRSSRGHHRLSTETRDASHNTKLRQRAPTDFHNPGKILPCEAQLIINTQDQDHKEDQAAESGCSNITKTRKTVSAGDRTRIGNPSEGKDAIQHSPLGAAARQGSKPRSKSPTRAQEVNIALGWRPTNTMYHEHFSYLDAELDALLQEFVPSAQRTLSLNARDSCREVPRTVAKNSVKRTQDCNFIVDHSSIRHDFTEPNLGVLLSSDQSSKPHGPKFHDVSPGTVRKSAHTLSRRSVDSFNRPDIAACTTDRQTPPVHPGVDFRSAWNGSETLYGRQEEQVGSVLDDFRHNISAQETEARTEDGRPRATDDQPLLVSSEPLFSGLQEINDFHNHEHGLYEAQHRVHENGNHAKEEPLNNDNFDDNCVYYKPLNAPNEDHFVEDHGMIHATSIVEEDDNEIRENEMIVGRDLTYQQTGLFENEIFDRSMSFTNPCRRPRLQAHTFDNRRRPGEFVEGEPEDPALSGFWTPHKLY